jgi:UDP-glucuronate 4-epimerase
MHILVTGVAGFIGAALALRLLCEGHTVQGVDNLNDYYDPALKMARLARLEAMEGFTFTKADVADQGAMEAVFAGAFFDRVVHLAAQAGVRHSLNKPRDYVKSNLDGFINVLEACRHQNTPHLVYASSSSVYGGNTALPFSESDNVDHPVSLYAATKKANELMAHAYSHLFRVPTTGLRFFTVYGPWGRPDMALFLFTRAILEGRPIDVFNHGQMQRDFTYIDDIIEGIVRVMQQPAKPDPAFLSGLPNPATSNAPYRVFNIGNHQPVPLTDFIEALENALGRKAEKRFLPMQPGDVPATYANTDALQNWTGFAPQTPVHEGVRRFVVWYREHYRV